MVKKKENLAILVFAIFIIIIFFWKAFDKFDMLTYFKNHILLTILSLVVIILAILVYLRKQKMI